MNQSDEITLVVQDVTGEELFGLNLACKIKGSCRLEQEDIAVVIKGLAFNRSVVGANFYITNKQVMDMLKRGEYEGSSRLVMTLPNSCNIVFCDHENKRLFYLDVFYAEDDLEGMDSSFNDCLTDRANEAISRIDQKTHIANRMLESIEISKMLIDKKVEGNIIVLTLPDLLKIKNGKSIKSRHSRKRRRWDK